MTGIQRRTLFIAGDSEVGKTTLVRRLFENGHLICVSSVDGATEYQVFLQGGETPLKILEIRNYAILTENVIEFDEERDLAFICYAIDDFESFQNVADMWIPLFKERVCETMFTVLIGNKRDLRDDDEVLINLAEQGLQPVSMNEGLELFERHESVHLFAECAINDEQPLDQLAMLINSTVLNDF